MINICLLEILDRQKERIYLITFSLSALILLSATVIDVFDNHLFSITANDPFEYTRAKGANLSHYFLLVSLDLALRHCVIDVFGNHLFSITANDPFEYTSVSVGLLKPFLPELYKKRLGLV